MEFTCGENIEKAFSEAIRVAKILNVWIEFDFNGVTCCASKDGSIERGINAYKIEIKKGVNCFMVFA